jgi:hypothetical protein
MSLMRVSRMLVYFVCRMGGVFERGRAVESGKWPPKMRNAGWCGVSPDQNVLSLEDRLSDDPNGHQGLSCNEGSEGARGVQEVKLFLLKFEV